MRLRLKSRRADVYVPDGSGPDEALSRTTHLCVGAHQDDVEIMAQHGIAECFQRRGRGFTGVVVTDGAGSPRAGVYSDCSDARMQEVRREEQRTAARIGGYAAMVQLGYPSSAAKDPAASAVEDDLLAVLAAAAPRVVYLHNPADKHDTHVAVLLKSLRALCRLPKARRPRQVLGCEVWRGLDWMLDEDKRALPASERPNLAAALLGVFDSQISGGKRYDLATLGRRAANATYFASHGTDEETALTFAMDLTPLLGEGPENLAHALRELVAGHVERFKQDALARIARHAR